MATDVEKYKIHQNGGRPYIVHVEEKEVSIYSIESFCKAQNAEWKERCSDKWIREYEIDVLIQPEWTKKIYNEIFTIATLNDYSDLVGKYAIDKIFIGDDDSWGTNEAPNFKIGKDCGCTSKGNTILLKLDGNKYVFISGFIYEFEVNDEITHYYSMIGPSNTPRPIAVSSENIYFLQDQRYVNKDAFIKRFSKDDELDFMGWKVWDYFYSICNSGHVDDMAIPIKNIQEISSASWN